MGFTRQPPSCSIQQVTQTEKEMSRSDPIETLRDLSSALWTIRTNQEAARVLRTTNSLLRCFLFFDICYLISGIALITMALTNQLEHKDMLIMHMAHSLYFEQTQWRHVFLFFANIAVFSCWRHMHKRYILMALPRPQHQTVVDVESVMREYLSPATTEAAPTQEPSLSVAMPEEGAQGAKK